MDDVVQRAQEFATQAHKRIDHRRKYTQAPYVDHLAATAKLVASVGDDAATIAAAWLHDTVEDTPATIQDIESEFGKEIAALVRELTDVSKPGDGNRAARKAIDRAHLARASTKAKTVKLADLINNCLDITRHDARFARTFLSEMGALLEVLHDGDPELHRLAQKTHTRCASRLGLKGILSPAEIFDEFHTTNGPVSSMVPRLFVDAFAAKDIASPLLSFDQTVAAKAVRACMQADGPGVAGIRAAGRMAGYIHEEDLDGLSCGENMRSFSSGQVITGDSTIVDLIQVLTRHSYCFVTVFDDVAGIISRDDINKPVVRMWLFGIVTIIEMYLTESIRTLHSDDAWQSLLTKGRLDKALSMYNERRRRGHGCELVDCLQLSDKMLVLRKDAGFMASLGFETVGRAKQAARELESLRNNLAHGQDIVTHDWAQIARMARQLEGIIHRKQ